MSDETALPITLAYRTLPVTSVPMAAAATPTRKASNGAIMLFLTSFFMMFTQQSNFSNRWLRSTSG
ncbi:hypothetical protein BDI4_830031 [Burkholderia diffusa]|nr:hypothetical protein BDI4_830031 [Burkholderia diffusa]